MIKDRLYSLADYYNQLDEEMKSIISDYLGSIPDDIFLSNDYFDYRPKNAYRLAHHSEYGKGKAYWKKFKNKINNQKI